MNLDQRNSKLCVYFQSEDKIKEHQLAKMKFGPISSIVLTMVFLLPVYSRSF